MRLPHLVRYADRQNQRSLEIGIGFRQRRKFTTSGCSEDLKIQKSRRRRRGSRRLKVISHVGDTDGGLALNVRNSQGYC